MPALRPEGYRYPKKTLKKSVKQLQKEKVGLGEIYRMQDDGKRLFVRTMQDSAKLRAAGPTCEEYAGRLGSMPELPKIRGPLIDPI